MCVCVYFSAVGFYLLLLLFSLLSKQPADHLLLPNTTANPGLDISGLMESSSWPLCLKPRAYRGIFVHFQTTNTAGSNCRFKDFCLSPAPNLSMTYIKLFWDWNSKRKYLGHFRWAICCLLQRLQSNKEGELLTKDVEICLNVSYAYKLKCKSNNLFSR